MVRDESQFHIFINEITHRIGWLARYYERLPSAYIIRTKAYAHDHGQTKQTTYARAAHIAWTEFRSAGRYYGFVVYTFLLPFFLRSFFLSTRSLVGFAVWITIISRNNLREIISIGRFDEKWSKNLMFITLTCVKPCNRCKVYKKLSPVRHSASHFYR